MKTIENDRKTLILVLVLFYNNGTKMKTKMLGSVYGIEITSHSKTKNSKRRYVENDRYMINLSRELTKTNNKLNDLIRTLIYIKFIAST
jgi:uncharacterized protein YukJ